MHTKNEENSIKNKIIAFAVRNIIVPNQKLAKQWKKNVALLKQLFNYQAFKWKELKDFGHFEGVAMDHFSKNGSNSNIWAEKSLSGRAKKKNLSVRRRKINENE